MKKYHGIIPPIITPIDKNENVDEEGFRQLLDYGIERGLHGIFVAGTNGETMDLTQKERNRAIKIALDQVNNRVPVIAGVMDSSTKRVIENIKALEDMGGTCAAVTPVFYDRHTSQSQSIRHFESILEETNVEVVIYDIPSFTGVKLNAATVIEIAKLDDKVVAFKDSSGGYTDFIRVLSEFKNTKFSVMEGVTPHALSAILLGADGFVPALAPCFPEMFVDAYNAAASKDVELTWKYNELIRESSKILGMCKNGTAAAKFAISLLGFTDKRVIAPQDITTPDDEAKIRAKFEEINELHRAINNSDREKSRG